MRFLASIIARLLLSGTNGTTPRILNFGPNFKFDSLINKMADINIDKVQTLNLLTPPEQPILLDCLCHFCLALAAVMFWQATCL